VKKSRYRGTCELGLKTF